MLVGKQLGVDLRQRIGNQQHIAGAGLLDHAGAIAVFTIDIAAQTRRELGGFGQPVATDRGRRQHQRRAQFSPLHQHCQGLHSLAQPHVIGQAGAKPGMGQPRHPDKTFELIGAQLGAQAGRQLRLQGGGVGQRVHALAPLAVAGHFHVGQGFFKPGSSRLRQLQLVFLALAQCVEVAQLLAQLLTQGQVLALAEAHETAARGAGQGHQLLQAEDALLVQLRFAGHCQPVLAAADLDVQPGAGQRRHAQRLALGPVERGDAGQAR